MNKKAQGLPIELIIIIAIGLAILVIFFIMFTSESGIFSKDIRACESRGGQCVDKGTCPYQATSGSCTNKGQECCINPLSR